MESSDSDGGAQPLAAIHTVFNAVKDESAGNWASVVDPVQERVKVEVSLPAEHCPDGPLACRFGDRVVPCSRDSSGKLACDAPAPKPCRGRYAREKETRVQVVSQAAPQPALLAEATFLYTAVPFWRKPTLEGRFSGRLHTKEDEKRLAEEAKLLAPLLGGAGKRGDKSLMTPAKLMRGVASGEVRKHCEARELELRALRSRVAALSATQPSAAAAAGAVPAGAAAAAAAAATALRALEHENAQLRAAMTEKDAKLVQLTQQLREKEQQLAAAHKARAAGARSDDAGSEGSGATGRKRARAGEPRVSLPGAALQLPRHLPPALQAVAGGAQLLQQPQVGPGAPAGQHQQHAGVHSQWQTQGMQQPLLVPQAAPQQPAMQQVHGFGEAVADPAACAGASCCAPGPASAGCRPASSQGASQATSEDWLLGALTHDSTGEQGPAFVGVPQQHPAHQQQHQYQQQQQQQQQLVQGAEEPWAYPFTSAMAPGKPTDDSIMQPAGLLDPPALPVSLSPPRHRQAAPKVYSTLAVPSMCCAGLVACGPDGRPIRQGSGASEASMRAASPAAAAPSTCSTPSGPSQLPAPAAPGLPAAAGSCQPSCAPMMQGQGQCCPQPSAAAACQQPPAAQPVVYQLARSAGHNGSGSGCMPWPAGMAGAAAAPCCPGGGQEMQQAVQGSGHVQALVGAGLQSVAVAAQQQQQPGGSDSLVQMLTAQMEEMQRLQRVQAEQARLQAAQLERLRNALVQHMGRDGQQ